MSGCVIVGSKDKLHGVGDYCGNVKMIGVEEPKVAANEKEVPGKKIEWDAKTMTAKTAPEVQHIVKREYRAWNVL